MSNRMLVATKKGIFFYERKSSGAGAGWHISSTAFLGDSVTVVLPDRRDGAIYAALELGHFGAKLHRSDDRGKSWQEVAVPAYPEPKPGEEVMDTFRNRPISWKLVKIWSLEGSNADEPGVLWAGTMPGGLFRSTDRGQTWNIVSSLWYDPKRAQWLGGGADWPGIHSICVHPRNNRRVLIGVSCGGVWGTHDGGETWECCATGMRAAYMPPEQQFEPNIQDPHRVVQCPARPEVLWAQHHNGVFRSTDESKSWQEIQDIPPSVFGFAVVVHPKDPDTAWFVPAIKDEKRIPVDGKVVVSRTRNGGKSFEVLGNGLPQEHAYDLVYRHCLDIDESGNRLAFGSTTGSVWVTEDQGDHWTALSEHLPPVYCVRFQEG